MRGGKPVAKAAVANILVVEAFDRTVDCNVLLFVPQLPAPRKDRLELRSIDRLDNVHQNVPTFIADAQDRRRLARSLARPV